MKTKGIVIRKKLTYSHLVEIPNKFASLFWDEPGRKTFLEKFILRILNYGDFEDIKWVYKNYREETYEIAMKYPSIKRGVIFWIKLWKEKELIS